MERRKRAVPLPPISDQRTMDLTIPNRILTRRLHIRPHTVEDADGFVEFLTDDIATRYLTFEPEQRTAKSARELLDFIITSYDAETPVFALAITERSNKAYLGSCGLSPVADKENAVECYFSLLPRYWGWGYATESMEALLYYAFVELKLDEVVANIMGGHEGAYSVAENAGMTDKGPVQYRDMPDAEHFAITKEEYLARAERMHLNNDGEDEHENETEI